MDPLNGTNGCSNGAIGDESEWIIWNSNGDNDSNGDNGYNGDNGTDNGDFGANGGDNGKNGTTFSEWLPVPADKDQFINEIKEGKKFQIITDKKIDESNDIAWTLEGATWFTFTTNALNAHNCEGIGQFFTDEDRATKGFFLRAGDLTFLKTNTQLQIWFDNVLEVTWIYEDKNETHPCAMRNTMTGLRFRTFKKSDKVSIYYSYEIVCTGLDPAWNNIRTETTFPVETGTELTVTCEDEFLQRGSYTVTCTDDTTFNSDTTPACLDIVSLLNVEC
ncbi:hypothetical protein ACHWQZ_G000486 [Mnemiopsis leidyi]